MNSLMARFGHLAKALVVEAMDVPGSWKMRMRPTDCRWQRLPLLQTQTGQIAGNQIGGAPLTPSNCRPTPPTTARDKTAGQSVTHTPPVTRISHVLEDTGHRLA